MLSAWRTRLASTLGIEPTAPVRLAIFAPGVWRKRKRLGDLLGQGVSFQFGSLGGAHAVAGWGLKGAGKSRASDAGVPYLALEDAFLATIGGPNSSYGLLGLIADPVGIYYDATAPSLCEELIAQSADEMVMPDTYALLAEMRRHKLSKFNSLREEPPLPTLGQRYGAIVVDQIAGDFSISHGHASADHFERMLDEACATYGPADVAVKLHPYDGIQGRVGHLRKLAAARGVQLLPSGPSWMTYAAHTDRVYVVTSNAGLEALIAGTPVTCFGTPFYGGWGLTEDRATCARRQALPTLEQLIQAVYVQYPQSWLPSNKRPGTSLELARFISVQKRHAEHLSGLKVAGMQKLKAPNVRPFAGPDAKPLSVTPSLAPTQPAVWASRVARDEKIEREWHSAERLFVEDGFIRSSGLGADLVRPSSLVFDSRGIYYDPSKPSDLENLLNTYELSDHERTRSRHLVAKLQSAGVTKYNLDRQPSTIDGGDRTMLLVPGQVANDASITKGASQVTSNLELLQRVRAANPDAHIIYKPHPDVIEAGRPGRINSPLTFADQVIEKGDTAQLIDQIDEVHTMTSLMGFEALLRGKRVTCYGTPFYAGWGLTTDKVNAPRRQKIRTIEELAFLSLIAYPYYIHPRTRLPCTPECLIEALQERKEQPSGLLGARTVLRLWRKLRTAPEYLRR